MIVKRSGSKIFGAHLTKNEHRALEIETRKMIVQNEEQYRAELDAAILYYLHTEYGFGKQRLRAFWDGFNKLHEDVIKHYVIDPTDAAWVCKTKLKDIGVDVEVWYREDVAKEAAQNG